MYCFCLGAINNCSVRNSFFSKLKLYQNSRLSMNGRKKIRLLLLELFFHYFASSSCFFFAWLLVTIDWVNISKTFRWLLFHDFFLMLFLRHFFNLEIFHGNFMYFLFVDDFFFIRYFSQFLFYKKCLSSCVLINNINITTFVFSIAKK